MRNAKNLITEIDYWQIIDKSLIDQNLSIEGQVKLIERELSIKSVEELVGFWYYNLELYRRAFTSHLLAAFYIAVDQYSDSSFHYFRCWLVTRGSKVYYDALKIPDSLIVQFNRVKYVEDIQYDFLFDSIISVYQDKGKEKSFEEVIEQEHLLDFEAKSEFEMGQIKRDWSAEEIEKLKTICPNIFTKFWAAPLKSKYLGE